MVNHKTCSKCKETKSLTMFDKNRAQKDGFCNQCKDCYKIYREKNKDKIKAQKASYQEANKDELIKKRREYHKKNREKILAYQKDWRKTNKEKIKSKDRDRYNKDKEYKSKRQKNQRKYYLKNKDKIKAYQKEYNKKNKDKILARQRNYNKKRRIKDVIFKLQEDVRSRVRSALKGSKSKRTQEIIGCSWEQLYLHLNLDNFENPSHDHIIPLSWAETEEELYALARWENLQGMEWDENFKKKHFFCDKNKAENVIKIHPNPNIIRTILSRFKLLDDLYQV